MPEKDALSTATLAEQDNGLTTGNIEIHPAQDLLFPYGLTQVADLDKMGSWSAQWGGK